jgi:hypothetical protein
VVSCQLTGVSDNQRSPEEVKGVDDCMQPEARLPGQLAVALLTTDN